MLFVVMGHAQQAAKRSHHAGMISSSLVADGDVEDSAVAPSLHHKTVMSLSDASSHELAPPSSFSQQHANSDRRLAAYFTILWLMHKQHGDDYDYDIGQRGHPSVK